MSKQTVFNRATPTLSASTPRVSSNAEQSGPAIQISKADWAHERIARRAYELYEQRGRQEGRDLEDWLNAERQLVAAESQLLTNQ
jgi:outer membrane protein TolC